MNGLCALQGCESPARPLTVLAGAGVRAPPIDNCSEPTLHDSSDSPAHCWAQGTLSGLFRRAPPLPEVDPLQLDLRIVENTEPEVGSKLNVFDLRVEPAAVRIRLE